MKERLKNIISNIVCFFVGHKVKEVRTFKKTQKTLAFSTINQYHLVTDKYCERCGKLITRTISRGYTKRELLQLIKQK